MHIFLYNQNCFLTILASITKIAAARPRVSHSLLLASQTNTPRFTPPGSPPSLSASGSPTRTSSKPVSPRRNAVSFSIPRGNYDDRSSVFSSGHGSMSGSGTGSQTGEFFQIRAFVALPLANCF